MTTNQTISLNLNKANVTLITESNHSYVISPDKGERIKNYLGPENYSAYLVAQEKNDMLQQSFLDNNLYRWEYVYENIYIPELNESYDIEIGLRRVLSPGVHPSDIYMHPEYVEIIKLIPPNI